MAPWFLGKGLGSLPGGSPSLRHEGDSYVIQGWRFTEAADPREPLHPAGRQQIPANEALIRFPKRLMPMLPELSSGR